MQKYLSLVALFAAACTDYTLQGEGDDNGAGQDGDTDSIVSAGDQPDIEITPATLDFGYLPTGCDPASQTVTVRNVGLEDLDVTAITLGGADDDAFALDAQPQVVAPGGSFTFEVAFEAIDFDEFQGTVTVASNDPDEPAVEVPAAGIGAEYAMMEEIFTQVEPDPVDVLWVIDNSGSMSEEVARLHDSFHVFMEEFSDLNLDYQLGVVSTDMDSATQAGRLQGSPLIISNETADPQAAFVANSSLGTGGSGTEKGLDAAYAALSDPMLTGHNAGFVRPEANLAIIVLSDEEDSSTRTTTEFVDWLNAYKGDAARTSLSSIVGPLSSIMEEEIFPGVTIDVPIPGCDAAGASAEPAPRYLNTASATGGMNANICDLDFDTAVQYLSLTAANAQRDFVLSDTPANVGDITVVVDGDTVAYSGVDGWTWDSSANAVQFNGDAVPDANQVITVTYPVATECPEE